MPPLEVNILVVQIIEKYKSDNGVKCRFVAFDLARRQSIK